MFNAINLAIRVSGGVENTVLVQDQRLYLQLLRLKNCCGLALGSDAIDTSWGSGGSVKIPCLIGGNRGWGGGDRSEGRCELQTSGVADCNPGRSSLAQIFEFGLFPGASALGEHEVDDYD